MRLKVVLYYKRKAEYQYYKTAYFLKTEKAHYFNLQKTFFIISATC